jgi:hypothetical protein
MHALKFELLARQCPGKREPFERWYSFPIFPIERVLVVASAEPSYDDALATLYRALGCVHLCGVRHAC